MIEQTPGAQKNKQLKLRLLKNLHPQYGSEVTLLEVFRHGSIIAGNAKGSKLQFSKVKFRKAKRVGKNGRNLKWKCFLELRFFELQNYRSINTIYVRHHELEVSVRFTYICTLDSG